MARGDLAAVGEARAAVTDDVPAPAADAAPAAGDGDDDAPDGDATSAAMNGRETGHPAAGDQPNDATTPARPATWMPWFWLTVKSTGQ